MITLEFLYVLMGLMAAGVAVVNARDPENPKRWASAAFWGLYAAAFLLGSHLPDLANGLVVLGMVAVASLRGLGQGKDTTTPEQRQASARTYGNTLVIPALVIPAVTVAGTLWLKGARVGGVALVDQRQVTLISLGFGTLIALAVAMAMLKAPWSAPVREARRLADAVGWAAVLPQMLATLGVLFAAAGVGRAVSTLAGRWLPMDSPFAAVASYTVGMAMFTMIMGNAFAAFPVMTAGIGLPLIVGKFGGDPTVMSAIGMLAGFCGTLMTPMAANFNIVPAALLELPDQHAVIKAQVPTGLIMLAANTALMYFLVFR